MVGRIVWGMATLAEDISFGTGLSVEVVEIHLRKNAAASLELLGADYYAEDGVTPLSREEQRAQLALMFGGITTADPDSLVLVGRSRRPA